MALGISLVLAFVVWLVHNLSCEYSAVVQRGVVAVCEIDGHSNTSEDIVEVAASCQMAGIDILGARIAGRRHPRTLEIARDDMHHLKGDVFYMTSNDLNKYFHAIFREKSRLEYFVTDTVYFTFNSVIYKKVPVIVTSNITFKPQYMAVGGLKVVPDSVLVYGESVVLDAVNAVTTELVRWDGLDSDVFGKVKIRPARDIRISAKEVDYSVNVVRYVQREEQLPVRIFNVPRGVNVKVFPSSATVRYRMKFPSDVSLGRTFVRVEYSDFVQSISGKCVGTLSRVPADVISYQIEPQVFDAMVEAY